MTKKFLFISLLFFAYFNINGLNAQNITGTYFVGDKKVTISMEDYQLYVVWPDTYVKSKLSYEENTPTNEQIWVVRENGNRLGTIVFKSDYSSGIYTDYQSGKESYVKKIE